MARVRETAGRLWRSYSVAVVVLALGVILSLLTPRFLMVGNLLNVMTNAAVIAIVGLGHDAGYRLRQLRPVGGRHSRLFGLHRLQPGARWLGVPVGIVAGLIVGAHHRPGQRPDHHRAAGARLHRHAGHAERGARR